MYGVRHAPEGDESVLFVANMQGTPVEVTPAALPLPGLEGRAWTLALATPRIDVVAADASITLADSEGVVMVCKK